MRKNISQKPYPSWWSRLRNPILFQGWGRKDHYFEGWYYKLVYPKQHLALAIIPGVSINKDDSHAFIQVMDGVKCVGTYHRFALDQFKASPDRLSVSIGDNVFSDQVLSLDLPELKCELKCSAWTTLPKTWLNPGIMGWYSYVPTMQCYHGLGSMYHKWSGTMYKEEQLIDVNEATGYVEKDWGTSFPRSWIWCQCNTFDKYPELSVFASVAHIPWKGNYFIGFLGAILVDGEIHTFATYNQAKRSTTINDEFVTIELQKGDQNLYIRATKAEGTDLRSPISGEMTGKVNESMLATINVKYSSNSKSIEATGHFAALEVAGPIDELLTKSK